MVDERTDVNMAIPAPALDALSRLEEKGYEAYLAGGCVRDFLLGKEPHDFDITTSARPEQVMEVFGEEKLIPTGLKHGTVTVLMEGMALEITTYRSDGDYTDGRRPDWVEFTTSLEEDLARRDFTINAFAYSPVRGMVDLFSGREDLQRGLIRCVGNPDERFGEDGLRILRAIRFASQLGFSVEERTAISAARNRELLQRISKERIFSEMTKLLMGQGAFFAITEFVDVIGMAIPEILKMKGFEQNNPYHRWDLLAHTAKAVENSRQEELLRWAAFLHDVGKPACYSQDEEGIGHFYGHEPVGADMAEEILRRLKCSSAFAERIPLLIRYHDMKTAPNTRSVKRRLNRIGADAFFQLLDLQKADRIAHQGPACKPIEEDLAELEQIGELGARIIEEGQCFSMKDLAVSGKDLIEAGFTPGKEMGAVLHRLLGDVIEERIENQKEVLVRVARDRMGV